jgi:hypothetical protein
MVGLSAWSFGVVGLSNQPGIHNIEWTKSRTLNVDIDT